MSISVSVVPVFGGTVVEYALALESMLLRKATIARLSSLLMIRMCACLY